MSCPNAITCAPVLQPVALKAPHFSMQVAHCGGCHYTELILAAGCMSTAHFCRNQRRFGAKLSRQFVLTVDGATVRLNYVELIARCEVTASRREKE